MNRHLWCLRKMSRHSSGILIQLQTRLSTFQAIVFPSLRVSCLWLRWNLTAQSLTTGKHPCSGLSRENCKIWLSSWPSLTRCTKWGSSSRWMRIPGTTTLSMTLSISCLYFATVAISRLSSRFCSFHSSVSPSQKRRSRSTSWRAHSW